MLTKIDTRNGTTGAVSLASTALEEFWDTSKPLIFLGEWCCRYSRRAYWESLGGRVIDSPWDSGEKLHGAARYVTEVYEHLLQQLATSLNRLHGLGRSQRYWRILLGPWLQLYIPVLYDRFISLQTALGKYPDLTTTVLAEEEWVTPRNSSEFVELIKKDSYNLQLFSAIFKLMGKKFPAKSIDVLQQPAPSAVSGHAVRWQERAKKKLVGMLISLNRTLKNGHSVILRDSYFSWQVEICLIVASLGKVWPLIGRPPQTPRLPLDNAARKELQNSLLGEDEFERLVCQMLPMDLPICFLEGFAAVGGTAAACYPAAPKAVFSANAWFYDEAFKQWAAASAEEGSILLGMQHGGNYGSLAFHSSEDHEIAIADRYFSWGWERATASAKVAPFYAAKLSGRKQLKADNRRKGILFVATTAPRFLFQFPHVPARFSNYLLWQSRFAQAIPRHLLPEVRVRFHREDLGWDISERWKALCPEVLIEGWDHSFQHSLENCRIYLCDHLSTTFLEALSVNKPVILFWNPANNELRPEARPYYEQLKRVGILHNTPESAAEALSAIYEDVESWWNQPERQAARCSFCECFARNSPVAVKLWGAKLREIAEKGITGNHPYSELHG